MIAERSQILKDYYLNTDELKSAIERAAMAELTLPILS